MASCFSGVSMVRTIGPNQSEPMVLVGVDSMLLFVLYNYCLRVTGMHGWVLVDCVFYVLFSQ